VISKPIKNDASNNGNNLKKSSIQVPIIIFHMLLAGRRTHNNIELLYGFEGVFMGLIMGSQNIMGSEYGRNISEMKKVGGENVTFLLKLPGEQNS
jgi:hypothetical protein